MRIGVDTGGTFTDFVAIDGAGRIVLTKSSTTPGELTKGILNCFDKAKLKRLPEVNQVLHGSTVAINAIIQRSGARTALVTTRGFRDVYEIGRSNRPDSYNLFFHRPRPLVARELRFEVGERVGAKGEILVALDRSSLGDLIEILRRERIAAVAVCFLHSYANPIHEQEVGALLRRELPGVYVTLSHELLRQAREYERTSTTVLNAYVGPLVSEYLDELQKRLRGLEFSGPLLIMQSNGGCMSAEVARQQPVATAESGPVSGLIGACRLCKTMDLPNVIAFDMGGTTAKASFVERGVIPLAPGYYIGGYGSGQPMMLPVADIIEIGAGGGSIAWLDEVGVLSVGPRSAGAFPGPVCYGQGGSESTVTDANVVLGRLDPNNFLGGEMVLNAELARDALREQLAKPKGLSLHEAADAIVQIVTANMSLAVRKVSVERGIDPRDCTIIAFGGAGPLHAAGVARELQIPKVVIPQMPGHFSALGMLVADLRHDYVQTYYHELKSVDLSDIGANLQRLAGEAKATLLAEGAHLDTIAFDYSVGLRYQGQNHVLQIPVTLAALASENQQNLSQRYDAFHLEKYGHNALGEAVEVVNLSMTASGRAGKDKLEVFRPIEAQRGPAPAASRQVYLGAKWGWLDAAIYQREALGAGFAVTGPAVVEERASTTVIFPGDRLSVDRLGNLVVELTQP